MGPVQLFEFASRQAEWLASRQSVIASNVAHCRYAWIQSQGRCCISKHHGQHSADDGSDTQRSSKAWRSGVS